MLQAATLDLVYWKRPEISGLVCGVGVLSFFLVGVLGWSTVTLLSYCLLGHLLSRFAYNNGTRLLADLKMIEKRPLPKAPDTFVTEEDLTALVAGKASMLDGWIHAGYSLLIGECNEIVLKWMAGLYALSLCGKLLGSTGTLFLAFALAMSVPKVYELKQREIDAALAVVKAGALDLWRQLMAAVPKGAAASAKKEN